MSYGTPAGEYPSVCRAAIVTDVPAHAYTIGLCVLNPSGVFFDRVVLADPGTYDGPERTFQSGAEMPRVTCDDVRFGGGTWHWPL